MYCLGDMGKKITLMVFLLAGILVSAGFLANEKAYAGGVEVIPTGPFGDFKCWENDDQTSVPPALFEITDQFGTFQHQDWFQGEYCAAATKVLGSGTEFPSPFEPLLNQHYQFWFYQPEFNGANGGQISGPGTGFIVDLEIPQFDNLEDVQIGYLDSIMVPATKTLPGGEVIDSVDFQQHWNCYDIEFPNELNAPDISAIEITTQHGDQIVIVLEPFVLCAPMIKADQFEPFDVFGTLFDQHLVCYDIEVVDGTVTDLPEFLFDQLTSDSLGNPQALSFAFDGGSETLCVPALKSFDVVGGFDVPINTSSLLLAGVQSISMWMIPVVIAGIGIGVFVIKRRK